MKKINRDDARKKLVKNAEGLYRIPLLCGREDNDVLTFTNRKKVLKFYGAYVLQEVGGKVVYSYDRDRDEELRRRELKARRESQLRKVQADPF